MAHLVCPRCQRTNPAEAVYCYFDGMVLRMAAGAGGLPPSQLPQEFVFPSGRRCRSYDDLVQGCQYEWEDARDLLRRGEFGRYLSCIGRLDLARSAQEAQAQQDADIALHDFVRSLPANQVQGPRLDLAPRRLMLGVVRAGEQRQVSLSVTNQGKGLLQGKLTVTEGWQWLKVVDGGGADGQCPLKTAREQQVTLRVDARGLIATQSYSAKLTVITNGGIAEVPVRLDLAAAPFPRPPFQGADSPRAIAERMRANPKMAAPLLESGEVARWFTANGWAYPVAGATARGVAAVQQFFEGMGLSKPPPLQLSEREVRFLCVPPEVVRGQVTLRTPSKKWVYAQAESSVPWLRVVTPAVSGPQQVHIAFEVDSGQLDEAGVHEGQVQIVANAGQKLSLRVQADVQRPRGRGAFGFLRKRPEKAAIQRGQTPRSTAVVGSPPAESWWADRPDAGAPHEPVVRGLFQPVLAGALLALVLRLLLAGPADLYARVLAGARTPPPGTLAAWAQPPADGFLKLFVLATWWLGGAIGLGLVWRRGGRWTDVFCGIVAGAGAGVAGSATAGCLLVALDGLPRALLAGPARTAGAESSPWLWTPLWIGLATVCWAVLGAAAGLVLSIVGRRGARLVAAAAAPLAWLCRLCGLERTAAFFLLQ